jgi:hypothetical protein
MKALSMMRLKLILPWFCNFQSCGVPAVTLYGNLAYLVFTVNLRYFAISNEIKHIDDCLWQSCEEQGTVNPADLDQLWFIPLYLVKYLAVPGVIVTDGKQTVKHGLDDVET